MTAKKKTGYNKNGFAETFSLNPVYCTCRLMAVCCHAETRHISWNYVSNVEFLLCLLHDLISWLCECKKGVSSNPDFLNCKSILKFIVHIPVTQSLSVGLRLTVRVQQVADTHIKWCTKSGCSAFWLGRKYLAIKVGHTCYWNRFSFSCINALRRDIRGNCMH